MKKLLIAFTCLLSLPCPAQQNPAFWDEIQAFKKLDSLQLPPKNAILFVGSSTFRLWPDIQQSFPNHTIINRGFGGSVLRDVIRYEQEVIFKYKPAQVVIYCGDNDLAASDTVTGAIVFKRFRKLFNHIRTTLHNVPVVFVSIKPSPSRWKLKDKMIEANALIKKFLSTQKKAAFVDIWPLMLDGEGNPIDTLYKEDKLHMKPEGYALWQMKIEPYLLKTKAQ